MINMFFSKKIFFLFFLFSYINLLGCTNAIQPPKEFKAKVNLIEKANKDADLSYEEINKVLLESMLKAYKKVDFKGTAYLNKERCLVSNNKNGYGTHSACYFISNNSIVNNFPLAAKWYEFDSLFVQNLNNFQEVLPDLFYLELDNWIKNKQAIKDLKFSYRDSKKLISDKYLKNEALKTLQTKDGIKLGCNERAYRNSYDITKSSDDNLLCISSLNENLLYEVKGYYESDKNLMFVEIFNAWLLTYNTDFHMENSVVSFEINEKGNITIKNKSKNYIKIDSISFYFKDSINTKENLNITVPPQSNTDVSSLFSAPIFSPRREPAIKLESERQFVKYGFSVGFYNQDANKRETIFKVTDKLIDF